jgi:hypothetical protein
MKIVFLEEARRELRLAVLYHEQRREGAGARLRDEVRGAWGPRPRSRGFTGCARAVIGG